MASEQLGKTSRLNGRSLLSRQLPSGLESRVEVVSPADSENDCD